MKRGTEANISRKFGLLLLGHPKHGKTSVAIAFPKVAILDCDRNLGGALSRADLDPQEYWVEDPNVDANGDSKTAFISLFTGIMTE